MNVLTHNILTIMENYKSIEIEAIIKEMQMIADRKYQEEEEAKIWEEARNNINQ